jgi:hypothetical protein
VRAHWRPRWTVGVTLFTGAGDFSVGVSGTPTFVIGRTSASGLDGVRMVGAQPLAAFDAKFKDSSAGNNPNPRLRDHSSSIDRGQSDFSSRDNERSASSRPLVWHRAQ